MKIPFALASLASLGFVSVSFCAEPPLSAEAAAQWAREKNPELAAARELIAEAEARKHGAARLPNPELETEIAGGQDFEGRVAVGITQRFPLTGRLRFERELSALDVETARLEVKMRELQIEATARAAWYELATSRALISLARRQTAQAEAFARSIEEGVAQGFGSQLDVQQASLEAETLRANEGTLESQEIEFAARLNELLGRPADTKLSLAESLKLPKSLPGIRPVGDRADLRFAEVSLRAGAADVSLAKANRWDDVGVGFFIEGERFRDEPEGIEPEALLGVQFSVPLPFWQNGSAKVAEKEAARTRKTRKLEALRLKVRNEVIMTYHVMSARHKSAMQVANNLVPKARENLSSTEAAFRRGELGLQAVFLARERLATIEATALEAQKNYFLSYSDWLAALGDPSTKP
jgi:cobalt-zinc-cadmium efflux system outer membrane protein